MRNLGVILFLARRSLAESRLILILLVGAVAAGVGFQVPNTANMAGYHQELLDHGVTSGYGDVRVRPKDTSRFDDGDALAARIRELPGIRAVVAALSLPGAAGKGSMMRGAPIAGIDIDGGALPFRLSEGSVMNRADPSGVVMGAALARRLGVALGDQIRLRVIYDKSDADLDDGVGRYDVTVRGIAVGTFGAHEAVFVDRRWLARESGADRAASIILVYARDHAAAPALARRIAEQVPEAQVRPWTKDSSYLRSAMAANDAIRAISEIMVVVAVSIPVLALLYINMLRRRRDVGLLAALGFGPGEVFVAFLLQAAVIGAAGVLIGSGIGFGVIRYFQANPVFDWEGFVIRPMVSFGSFARPAAVVFLAAVLAGVVPAWRASRVDPARVLRGPE